MSGSARLAINRPTASCVGGDRHNHAQSRIPPHPQAASQTQEYCRLVSSGRRKCSPRLVQALLHHTTASRCHHVVTPWKSRQRSPPIQPKAAEEIRYRHTTRASPGDASIVLAGRGGGREVVRGASRPYPRSWTTPLPAGVRSSGGYIVPTRVASTQ
jgi:hypothetical protein